MPDEVPLKRKLLPTIGRGLWYVCAAILLLSLPTFSFLVPTLQGPASDEPSSVPGGFVSSDSLRPVPEGTAFSGNQFVRSRSGGYFSRGPYRGNLSTSNRSRRVHRSTLGSKSRRGLNRLSRREQTKEATQSGQGIENQSGDRGATQASESVINELSQMEQAFQGTLNYLFPAQAQPNNSGYVNPFQSALNGRAGGGSSNSNSSGDQDSSDDEGASDEGDGSDDSGSGSSGSSDSDDEPDDTDSEPKPYTFLLIGEFETSNGLTTVSRAYQQTLRQYVLEDGTEVSLYPGSGVVGVPRRSFLLSDDEMLLSADFNGDGSEDVIVAGWGYPVSSFRGFLRQGQLSSVPDFEAFLQFVKVESVAVYDFESDGSYELAVLFSGNPHLVIYTIEDRQLSYVREILVPFEPSLLVTTQDQGVFKRRYLQVLEPSLQRSIVFSSLFPGTYSFSTPSSFQSISSIQLDSPAETSQGEQFSLLRYDDVMVVVENRGDEIVFLASFSYRHGFPKLAIGRAEDDGSRQLIFVPRGG